MRSACDLFMLQKRNVNEGVLFLNFGWFKSKSRNPTKQIVLCRSILTIDSAQLIDRQTVTWWETFEVESILHKIIIPQMLSNVAKRNGNHRIAQKSRMVEIWSALFTDVVLGSLRWLLVDGTFSQHWCYCLGYIFHLIMAMCGDQTAHVCFCRSIKGISPP